MGRSDIALRHEHACDSVRAVDRVMVRASHLRAISNRAGKVLAPDPGSSPFFVSSATAVQNTFWGGSRSVNVSITVPSSGGALLIPFGVNSSSWQGLSSMTRSAVTNRAGNTVVAGQIVDAYSGSGSEAHGGVQVAWIINPTVETHTLTITASPPQNYQTLFAGALFYANCTAITASGLANGAPATSRSFNVASAVGRRTVGVFFHDNSTVPTLNGTKRWDTISGNNEGWVDRTEIQDIPGAASVSHTLVASGGGWGFGLDLAA